MAFQCHKLCLQDTANNQQTHCAVLHTDACTPSVALLVLCTPELYYVGLVLLVACYCYLLLQLLEGSLVETVPSGRESNALSTLPSTTPGPSSHTDVTSGLINIVDDVDTVVDTVGEHQTSLQALLGTSSASSFMEDLNKWRNILQTIEAVLKLWMSVQDLWCLLREVSTFNALVVFFKLCTYV